MRANLWSTFLVIALGILLLQGCEDDPILEPTGDESGGGSYGKMSSLVQQRAGNPEIF